MVEDLQKMDVWSHQVFKTQFNMTYMPTKYFEDVPEYNSYNLQQMWAHSVYRTQLDI